MQQSESFQRWYTSGRYFVHRGHPVFYQLGGDGRDDGETLLLIHGFPTSSWDWHLLWPAFCARFSRVIAADMIGFGHSAKPRDYDYRILDWADLQERLLIEQGVESYHVIAQNIGSNIVQELLARQIERGDRRQSVMPRMQSACLLNGGLFPETQRPTMMHRLLNSRLGPLLSSLFNERRFNQSFLRVFGPNTKPTPAALKEFWLQATCNGGTGIAHRLVGYISERTEYRDRWVGALMRAPVPLRLIDGLADPMSGAHMVERYRELVPNADVVALEGIGHYPHIEAPQATLEAFEKFQTSLDELRRISSNS